MEIVYVKITNCIGVVIDKGSDNYGAWYRTDCDGIREPDELVFLKKQDVKNYIKKGVQIAPSTKKIIGI